MMSLIKRLILRRPKNNPKLNLIYQAEDGVKFYSYANPTDMPITRTVAAEAAIRIAEWGLSKARLRELVAMLGNQLNRNEPPDRLTLFQVVQEISIGLESVAEEEALFGVAAALILMDGEPQEYDSAWAQKKIDRWKRRPAERNFFLLAAWTNCKQFAERANIDILSYLQQIAPLQRDLPFALRRLGNTLTKLN